MEDTLVYSYIEEIAKRLKNPRKYGEATLMVGAGFSKNAKSKGLNNVQPPNWSQIANDMYCELYPEPKEKGFLHKKWEEKRIIKTSGKNVTKLAEEYIASYDRNKINHLIEQSIANDSFLPGELHKKLLKFSWGDIFTTNYDTLLEQTTDLIFRKSNYKIVYSQNDLPGSIKPRIIKLHGSIPQIKPYIICDEDFRIYPIKYSAMVNTVQQAMLETRLCLIGFSGDDPNFQSWLGWLRDNMGENCPKIYLIGAYDGLSEPEKRLLENKKITIIDISVLVKDDEEDKHKAAFSEFLNLLDRFQKDEDMYEKRPYPKQNILWKPGNELEYIEIIEAYSSKVWKWMHPYFLLPEKIRKQYAKYFSVHFDILLKTSNSKGIVAIGYMVRILRKCLLVLDDDHAELLKNISNNVSYDKIQSNIVLEALSEIQLYLLEMFRIDGVKEDYEKEMVLLEKYCERTMRYKNEMFIEKAKNELDNFRYDGAKLAIESIEENSFEYKVKKAGLYKQLSRNMNTVAEKILNECSAELAQMQLSDEIYASFRGYLNLCHRAGAWDILDEFSDLECYDDDFNTRRIIVSQREELSQDFFLKDSKEDEKVLPFNLNKEKNITIMHGNDPILSKSFNFIIAIDRLCLPLFSDQVSLLPRVTREVMNTSNCAYWKKALIIRANSDKTINQVFNRETLASMSVEDIKLLFDSLMNLAEMYKKDPSVYDYKVYIISFKVIINILSRLAVFLTDDHVIHFVELLSSASQLEDVWVERDIKAILGIISQRLNINIAIKLQNFIFMDFGKQYNLASYFLKMEFEIDAENTRRYYGNAIKMAESLEEKERNCGITQLLLLWKNCEMERFKDKIVNACWREKKELPTIELYYPFIWEELPHPEEIDFSELYYDYLLTNRYIYSVTANGFVGNNSLGNVVNQLNFIFSVSRVSTRACEKIKFDESLCKSLLKSAYEFLEHEKSLLNRNIDILGEVGDAKRKFELIGELVALIYINALLEGIITLLKPEINKIKQWLIDKHICIEAIDMVEAIENRKYSYCMEIFENVVLSKNKEYYSSAFLGIQCLLYYLECNKETDEEIKSAFGNFFGAIKYWDIEHAKTIWSYIAAILRRKFFMNQESEIYIASAIHKCINIYKEPAQQGERYFLDGLYNCISALQEYYKHSLKSKTEISKELSDCIIVANGIENHEIRSIFCNEDIN